jgi:predicted acyltransferase
MSVVLIFGLGAMFPASLFVDPAELPHDAFGFIQLLILMAAYVARLLLVRACAAVRASVIAQYCAVLMAVTPSPRCGNARHAIPSHALCVCVRYGYVLYTASGMISDGSELLLLVPKVCLLQ